MRATKITKYFDYDNKNPLNFFPNKQKKEEGTSNSTIKCQPTLAPHSTHIPKTTSVSSFDTINIQLETKYYTCGSTVEYFIYFNNNCQLDIKGSITNVGNAMNGDLMALQETLKYIVYHPNMSQKLNRYKFNIYTNSKTISNIFIPDTIKCQTAQNPELDATTKGMALHGTNLYLQVQSLLKCIKNISIEYWNSNQG